MNRLNPNKAKLDEALIKSITGGERIMARQLKQFIRTETLIGPGDPKLLYGEEPAGDRFRSPFGEWRREDDGRWRLWREASA